MNRIVLFALIFAATCNSIFAQKLSEPKLFGSWIAGEDPSEFLLHTAMEHSQNLLQENPNGKLIVRICSRDKFSPAFIKTTLNPLAASSYNQFRLLVPYEKIFITSSSKCSGNKNFSYNEYWFAPDEKTPEYEEIFSVNNVSYKVFSIDEDESKSRKQSKIEFAKILKDFSDELKNKPDSKGFIIYNSSGKRIRRSIEKVTDFLKNNGVNTQRIETVMKNRLELSRKGELITIKDKTSFPSLAVIEIKR